VKIPLKTIHFAALLLKTGGPKHFLFHVKGQIYGKSIHIGLEKKLQENGTGAGALTECKIKYSLRLGRKEDLDEVLKKAKSERGDSAYELVFRRWLYECGVHNWYIANTADTNEICFIQAVIHPEDTQLVSENFNGFPELKESEVLLEGAYTFQRYRGNRLHPAVVFDILEICRKKGFKRVITYIEKNNEASLKSAERLGFVQFEEVSKRSALFFSRRKHSLVHRN
jgi:RimJ/RimL family protein N-acetyltransferase